MDVNQVLKNTLSSDATTRSNAEQQLSQAAEGDFSGYLRTLAQELANEQADRDVRMAAGLALKNSFSSREYVRLKEVQIRWLTQIDGEVKNMVKSLALKALAAQDVMTGTQAAQFIASIAAIELPKNQWPELMTTLVANVGNGHDRQKQASLATIGFICEQQDAELQTSLSQHSNAILTAVVQGARREEPNAEVRNAAMSALGDCLEFVRANFENEGERNYIMQVVCEATQAPDNRIQQGAYGCLNRIMALYYDKMFFYMEKALFGLTIQGMKNEDEDVAKLAIEFWCTVCEEEISIEDDNIQAQADGAEPRPHYNFARIATQEIIPVLLSLLTQQEEDDVEEEYNKHRAAYQCLQLYSQAVGNTVVGPVVPFVESNIRNEDWRFRDAAVSAFGAIMEGPDDATLSKLVETAMGVLIGMMEDPVLQVRDSTAFTLGRVSECVPSAINPELHMQALVGALFNGLGSSPKMASSCCWALMNLAERFAGDPGCEENALTPHFNDSVSALLHATERPEQDNGVRTAAYEVLNAFVTNSANTSTPIVAHLSNAILERLENTIPLRSQVVSVEDKLTLDDMQTSLCTVILAIVQRLEMEIKPQADRIMTALLQILNTLNNKSSVADSVFAAVGGLANALGEDFENYMSAFAPYLYKALGNKEEPGLCAMAIGLVSDITRALEEKALPYCNDFMNYLLDNLRSTALSNQFKPAILQCFGDIAQAIGGNFEQYLSTVAQVLDQAASINIDTTVSYEMLDYVVSLREGIMDAWAGAIGAMKSSGQINVIKQYIESIFRLLRAIASDNNRSEGLLRSSMGVIGDIADAFPQGDFIEVFRQSWLMDMIKETRTNRDYSSRTTEVAKWAREQVKRQIGMCNEWSEERLDRMVACMLEMWFCLNCTITFTDLLSLRRSEASIRIYFSSPHHLLHTLNTASSSPNLGQKFDLHSGSPYPQTLSSRAFDTRTSKKDFQARVSRHVVKLVQNICSGQQLVDDEVS